MKKVLIAGGTGLIGKEITKILLQANYSVHILSRSKRKDTTSIKYYQWDVEKQWIEEGALEVDYIINLAGAGIADKRWTKERKKVLIGSRVNSAETIRKACMAIQEKGAGLRPKAYISASAIGYYGDSGNQLMQEKDLPVDQGFLSECTVKWETAAHSLHQVIDRIAIIRVGIVLSKDGGAFAKMLLPLKARMASYFGNGSMHYSWIHIQDIARIFVLAIENEEMKGVYNGAAPEVVTNKELTKIIKDVKGGFYLMNSVPAPALRLAMGEMADVVLTSNKVSAEKIQSTGFIFDFPQAEQAIKNLLNV